jgi:hypothetical protein
MLMCGVEKGRRLRCAGVVLRDSSAAIVHDTTYQDG